MKTKEAVRSIVDALKALYPDGICSLNYEKDYELLFSVRLAAQCTDERVNKVTPALYARFPTLEDLAGADVAEVDQYIHSTGFFRAKARDIVLASQMLLRDYGGKVPGTMEELLKLPGVGRKTANLMLGDVFHVPGVVPSLDVHPLGHHLCLHRQHRGVVVLFPLGDPLDPADNDGTKYDHKSDRNDNKHDPEHRVKAVEAIRIIMHRHLPHLLPVPSIQDV